MGVNVSVSSQRGEGGSWPIQSLHHHHPPSSSSSLACPLQSQKVTRGAKPKRTAQRVTRRSSAKMPPSKAEYKHGIRLSWQRMAPSTLSSQASSTVHQPLPLWDLTLFYLKHLIYLGLSIYSKFLLWKMLNIHN